MTVHAVPVFSDPRYANPLASSMAGFLASIGLKTTPVVLPEAGFELLAEWAMPRYFCSCATAPI